MMKITPFMIKYGSNTNVFYSSLLRFRAYTYKQTLHRQSSRRHYLYDESFDINTEYSDWWIRIKYFNKRLSKARSSHLKTLRSVSDKPER